MVAHSPAQVGVANQEGHRIPITHVGQKGQHLMADPVASEPGIGVRRIDDRREAQFVTYGLGVRPPQPEDGAVGAGADAGGAGRAGAPEQLKDHRLGLVVGGVTGQDTIGKNSVPGLPSPVLEIGAGLDLDRHRPPRHPQELRHLTHAVTLGVGAGPQPVIDVYRLGVTPGGDGEDQKSKRVGTARHCAHNRPAGSGNEHRESRSTIWGSDRHPGSVSGSILG